MPTLAITGPDHAGKYHPSYKLTPTFFRPICECSSLAQAIQAVEDIMTEKKNGELTNIKLSPLSIFYIQDAVKI